MRALRRGLFALAMMGSLAFAAPSGAGELVAIRVGEHPAFTRVVFELDVAGGYRIERDAEGEAPGVVRVTLDAASPERRIASGSSGVKAVAVEAGSPRSVARIDTRGADRPIREMILADPPRVVLDFMRPEPVAASRPAPPAPPLETAATPRRTPEPEPDSEPAPVVPAPPPEPVAQAVPPVEPEPASEEPEIPEPAPAVLAELEPEQTAAVESADTTLAEAPAPDEADAADEMDPASAAEPIVAESTAATDAVTEGTGSMGLYAATAGVLVVLLGGLFFMRRRRSSDPDSNVDVSSLFSESDDDATDDRPIPKEGFSMGGPPASSADEARDPTAVDETPTVARTSAPVTAGRGMEDEALEEKEAMQDNDMTIGSMDSEAPTQLGVGANVAGGAASGNIVRIIQDMESRIAHLEARLDESVEARKQLEQQVAAQTEELRVQRAAIARTQRALRSMSRGDEEQATEPALRNPDAAPRSE